MLIPGLSSSPNKSEEGHKCYKKAPPPEEEKDFVVNMIKTKYADCVDVLLPSPTAPPPVVTASWMVKQIFNFKANISKAESLYQFWGRCCTWGSFFQAFSAPLRVANNTAKPGDKTRSVETGED